MIASDPPPSVAETSEALASLLRWYVAMGVDAAIDEAPHDRFIVTDARPSSLGDRAAGRALSAQSPSMTLTGPDAPPSSIAGGGRVLPTQNLSAPPMRPDGPPASADALIRQAHELAASAGTLEALRETWEGFQGCALASTASRMIFAGGNPAARIMIFGAAPGSDDERQGEAFAGAPGRLVDGMLGAIGLSRQTVYLANVIPWRPPGNRPPTPLEAALCLPFTRRHIALAQPALILCPRRAGRAAPSRHQGHARETQGPLADLRRRYHDGETRRDLLARLSPQSAPAEETCLDRPHRLFEDGGVPKSVIRTISIPLIADASTYRAESRQLGAFITVLSDN